MNYSCRLSSVAKDYLETFYGILNRMIEKMTGAKLTDSISHNFIVQMIPHHMAAIEMSDNILRFTTNTALQDIAEQIITEQTKSIKDLSGALDICSEFENSERDINLYQNGVARILDTMFSGMRDAPADNRINCDFMCEMIPHHMGAVKMSLTALEFDICSELKPFLHSIITQQKRGIVQMQNLLRRLGC